MVPVGKLIISAVTEKVTIVPLVKLVLFHLTLPLTPGNGALMGDGKAEINPNSGGKLSCTE